MQNSAATRSGEAARQPAKLPLASLNTSLFDKSTLAFVEALAWPAMLIASSGDVHHVNRALLQSDPAVRPAIGGRFERHFPEYHAALGGEAWLSCPGSQVLRTLANGEQRLEQLSMVPLARGACLIITDETERWKLETANVQTIRLASLGFMLASVSHEIRNPLTAISSMVQLMQSGAIGEADWKEGLKNISSNVRSLLAITRKLTVFSRSDQEPQAAFRVDFAIEEAILLFSFDSLGETVQVAHQKDNAAIVYGWQGQVQQVVFNILLNAAQAMKGRGNITITTRISDAQTVDIAIADNGPGIPQENLAVIFEPFFTTKPSGEGTGLGLALSNEIAHEHGGQLWAENLPAGGACFHIQLPLFKQ